jgi:hypothetical protein
MKRNFSTRTTETFKHKLGNINVTPHNPEHRPG